MVMDILKWSGSEQMRSALLELSESTEYRWLGPIVGDSLENIVVNYLIENKPVPDRFLPLDVEENISQANSLLTRCLDRRAEIMNLEATALDFAVQSWLAEQIMDSDEAAFRLQLAANQKEVGDDELKIEQIVSARFKGIRDAHRARVNLHNSSGSPLNYGERANRIRRLYCESVRVLSERLIVISGGAEAAFGFRPPLIPTIEDIAKDLDNVTWWLRSIVRSIEDVERRQTEHIVSFRVFRDLVFLGSLEEAATKFHATGDLDFTLTAEAAEIAGLQAPLEKCRIIGVSVFVVGRLPAAQLQDEYLNATGGHVLNYDVKKRNIESINDAVLQRTLSYQCTVQAPKQSVGGKSMVFPKLDLGHVRLCFEAPPSEWQGHCPKEVLNASPIGKWRISVGDQPLLHYKGVATRKSLYMPISPPKFIPTTPPPTPQAQAAAPEGPPPSVGTISLGLPLERILQDVIICLKLVCRSE